MPPKRSKRREAEIEDIELPTTRRGKRKETTEQSKKKKVVEKTKPISK